VPDHEVSASLEIKRTAEGVLPEGFGPLRQVLEQTATERGCSRSSLTVLSAQRDPYRLDTPAGHRDGKWFAQQVERFINHFDTVHLRGLHYRISASADVLKPNGRPYVNTDEDWEWLTENAAKSGRWLGYVDFSRIVDERNAPAEIYVPDAAYPRDFLSCGSRVELPLGLKEALPKFHLNDFRARQVYRIVLFGEKTSLRDFLLPIAERVGGELLLPTGEASDTILAEMAQRAAADDRPAVVLYFSDFDPSGWQMAISVSRKLQALRDLLHHDLDIQVHPVALTLEQVQQLELPSTPLKETERRADRWREVMGHEQTEIDALIALNPEALREIARDAVRPFYDPTLEHRVAIAESSWLQQAARLLEAHPAYQQALAQIEAALERVREVVVELQDIQETAQNTLESEIEPPAIVVPEPQLSGPAPEPLFSTEQDYYTASRKLISHKALT
jgi:hypothetical protein